MKLDLLSLLDAVSNPPRIFRASIYLSFVSRELDIPLACKVSEAMPNSDNPPRSSMTWENLRSSNTDKNCIKMERLASCFLPSNSMPSAETILEWAVNSVQQLPSGVIEDFFGPLYTFAANYIRVGSRPLVSQQMPLTSAPYYSD